MKYTLKNSSIKKSRARDIDKANQRMSLKDSNNSQQVDKNTFI